MRRILGVGCAGLLAFTIATQSASAADLNPPPITPMPVKAPAVVEAPPPDYTWVWVAAGVCAVGCTLVALCLTHTGICTQGPTTTGAN
jgi:hypothetical protein